MSHPPTYLLVIVQAFLTAIRIRGDASTLQSDFGSATNVRPKWSFGLPLQRSTSRMRRSPKQMRVDGDGVPGRTRLRRITFRRVSLQSRSAALGVYIVGPLSGATLAALLVKAAIAAERERRKGEAAPG